MVWSIFRHVFSPRPVDTYVKRAQAGTGLGATCAQPHPGAVLGVQHSERMRRAIVLQLALNCSLGALMLRAGPLFSSAIVQSTISSAAKDWSDLSSNVWLQTILAIAALPSHLASATLVDSIHRLRTLATLPAVRRTPRLRSFDRSGSAECVVAVVSFHSFIRLGMTH